MLVKRGMRPRVGIGRFLVRLGGFIQSLAIMVMRPDDLVEYSRQHYSGLQVVNGWTQQDIVDSGLFSEETALLEELPVKEGRLLLLGVGGGREAIPLARMGFAVTGVDIVPEMVARAKKNAAARGVKIEGLVHEISRLEVTAGTYDVCWLSAGMYSSVPTRKRRVEMLRRIKQVLRPGGYFICQFHWDAREGASRLAAAVRKAFAFFTLGNLWHERGDMLWGNVEFIHAFSSEDELRSEFKETQFKVVHIHIPEKGGINGGAVLRKQ